MQATPLLRRALLTLAAVPVLVALGWLGWAWNESRLPGTYDPMDYALPDYGGGPASDHGAGHGGPGIPLASLRGPAGEPDRRFALTAQRARVRLASGRSVDALTFDGRVPGPELRVRRGDLVEVTLRNRDVRDGVSLHWHGVDVPNAEDGVAGVTQDAVLPGGTHVYRFRVHQEGTFWYHTHQSSARDVRRGLFGAFVIEPRTRATRRALDLALIAHRVGGRPALNASDVLARRTVAPGTAVRLRLANANGTPQRIFVEAAALRVVAIDGTALASPPALRGARLELPAGGRNDVAFTMGPEPVRVTLPDAAAGLLLTPQGRGGGIPSATEPEPIDPATYSGRARAPFGPGSRFDRTFTLEIGRKPGFLDGRPGFHWALNGGIFPRVPVFVVRRGDLVRMAIRNDTKAVHPMHLHGHHALVLSRDGAPVRSTWWTDTLDVRPGERYEIAFRADNPGLWMNHCHNLPHAAEGLTMHLVYEGVAGGYRTGGPAHNHPE